MNKLFHTLTAYVLCVSIALTGCLSIHTNVAGIEPIARSLEVKDYEDLGTAEGESSCFHLFWFLPVTPPLDYDKAVTDAISKKNGDNLINLRFWIERQINIMGTIHVLYVKGNVIRYKR
jgi:hypothetical protein